MLLKTAAVPGKSILGAQSRHPARKPLHGTRWALTPPCAGLHLRSAPYRVSFGEQGWFPGGPPRTHEFSSRPPLLYSPAFGLFADLDELFISPFLLQQFLMRTPLIHSSAINHKDLVGVLNRGQTMGNRNNSFTVC